MSRRGLSIPAQLGWSVLLVMLLAAINYQNNMGYALTFLLANLFVVAVMHSYANLAGLRIEAIGADDAFAGQRTAYCGAPMIGIVGVAVLGRTLQDPDQVMPLLQFFARKNPHHLKGHAPYRHNRALRFPQVDAQILRHALGQQNCVQLIFSQPAPADKNLIKPRNAGFQMRKADQTLGFKRSALMINWNTRSPGSILILHPDPRDADSFLSEIVGDKSQRLGRQIDPVDVL